MKAFVFTEKGMIRERELPDAALDPVLEEDRFAAILKPVYVSPCSSDVHTVYAGPGPRREDLVLGHEGLAEVLQVGDGVKDFKPGDLVAVAAVMPEPGDVAGHKGMPFSATKLGRNINGMWSEAFKVPMADSNLAHIPAGLSMEAALMAVDMMATGFTAAEEADIREGQTVLIFGSGAVGLMAAAAAMRKGAWRILMVGTDKSEENIRAAADFGVDAYISYRDGHLVFGDADAEEALADWASSATLHKDPRANATSAPAVETIFALTRGACADRVLICGGGADTIAQACDAAAYGHGVVVNVAYMEGAGMVGLPIFSLGRGMAGKSFKFCLSRGGRAWIEQMLFEAAAMEAERGPAYGPGRLVTQHMSGFDRIPEGLEAMRDRKNGLIKLMLETKL